MRKFIQSFLGLLLLLPIIGFGQTCPVYDKRNNGQGTSGCAADSPPAGKIKSGQFDFTNSSTSTNYTVDSIQLNGQLYQAGSVLYNSLGTVWFGGYNGTSNTICFYGNNVNDNTPPAGRWKFFFKNNGTQTICSYTLNTSGTLSSLTPGTIGSNQTICSGNSPSSLTNTSSASGCSSGSPTYQWQSSTTSSTSGYSNISGATSSTYSPGTLSQTTYFIRVASCSDGSSASTDPVTITVISAGTISPQPGATWSGNTTTFSSDGTSGGTWSVVTSPASGVATINASTGVLTATAAGSGTVTYTVTSGSTTCTSTRTFNVYNTGGTFPVTWETVTAEKINGQSLLKWSTASEQNTKDFEVQYSTNTNTWEALGTVPAAGNSSTTRNYSYIHQNPLKGNNYNYYRILQRDLDGKFSYSKIVSVLFGEPGSDVMLYPNPADDVATVFLAEAQEITLLNAAGAVVLRSKLPAGRSTIAIEKYSPGVYILRAASKSIRFVIQ